MLPVMSLLPVLLLFLVQPLKCRHDQPNDAFFLLSGNDPKRTSKCSQKGERTCRFRCLQGKCSNEEIIVDKGDSAHLQCDKAKAACLGHIMIKGWSEKNRAEKATMDCDHVRVGSCDGSQIKFIDVNTQVLNGDVHESDILFQNAENAIINLLVAPPGDMKTVFHSPAGAKVAEHTAEGVVAQFNLNEVYTRDVKYFLLNAMADYSATGTIFDLTGVSDGFSIKCKGKDACDGSLFIVDRCVKDTWGRHTIYCWPEACNDISIWVLHDAQKIHDHKNQNSENPICNSKSSIVTLKAWNDELEGHRGSGSSAPPPKEKPSRNVFLFADLEHIKNVVQDMKANPILASVMQGLSADKITSHGVEVMGKFNIHESKTRVDWLSQIKQTIVHDLNGVNERENKNGWTASNEGVAFLGATFSNSLVWRLGWGVQTQSIAMAGYILHGVAFKAALVSAGTPLFPIAIATGAWNVGYRLWMKPKQARYSFPTSKLAEQSTGGPKEQVAKPKPAQQGAQTKPVQQEQASIQTFTSPASSELSMAWSIYALMSAMLIACAGIALLAGCAFGVCGALIARKMENKNNDRNQNEDNVV